MLAETMFSARKPIWNNLGVTVQEAPSSADAIKLAGLDWTVEQKELFTEDGIKIPNQYANVRSSDNKPLGIVGERYKIVNNADAFTFTDELLGEGVTYETAGSLKGGRQIWLLARMPETYKILGDEIEPYLMLSNSHDGSGSIKVAMTPVRIWCQNTLNLALRTAKRVWSVRHTQSLEYKMAEARETLKLADAYMASLNNTFEELYQIKVDKDKAVSLVQDLLPIDEEMTDRKKDNVERVRTDIMFRWEEAPDLKDREQTAARFIQAVIDTSVHQEPLKLTKNYQENFLSTQMVKNELADRAMKLVGVAA